MGVFLLYHAQNASFFWHSDTFLLGLTRHLKKWAVGRAVSRATWVKSPSYISPIHSAPRRCVVSWCFFVAVRGDLIAPTSKWLSHDAKVAAGKEAPERFAHVDIEKCTHSQRHQKHNLTQKHHPATSGQATRVTETHQKDLMLSQEIPQKQTIFRVFSLKSSGYQFWNTIFYDHKYCLFRKHVWYMYPPLIDFLGWCR